MELTPYRHRAQYYETDQMGVVHHSNYIRWFEEARTDCMEQLGLPYNEMERGGIIIPVIGVNAEYKTMTRLMETVEITCRLLSYNGVRFTMGYEVRDEATGTLRCAGTTQHCFIDRHDRPIVLKKASPAYHLCFLEFLEQSKEGRSPLEKVKKVFQRESD